MTNAVPSIDDCFLHDKDRLTHGDALDLLRERLAPIAGAETIECANALGRIAAKEVTAAHMVPLHTNAAVDGYAFRHADLGTEPLQISQRIAAGDLNPAKLQPGTAARIFTGAVMPEYADTVAMQEDCEADKVSVRLPDGLKAGANCRKAGEDVAQGDVIVRTGHRMKPGDLAALASVGVDRLEVREKLRIACFSSGDELHRADRTERTLEPGEVYDANWPLLAALLAKLPVTVTDGGVLRDDQAAVRTAIADAARHHDIIITSGGASRGAEDHMLSVLDELGKRHLWQLAVKPGRPMMFGQIPRKDRHDCLFFGLPGNPVAAMVCFLFYTRPALLRLGGAEWETPPRFPLAAAFDMPNKKPDRREFLRGVLRTAEDGTLLADKFARDGSGLISSLRMSEGFIEIPEAVTKIKAGDRVSFIPFSTFD